MRKIAGPAAVAGKGVLALGALLANEPEYTLIDRRDFLAQIQASGGGAAPRPSFLRAAQALNADVVLRGVLLSFAPGRERVDQDQDTQQERRALPMLPQISPPAAGHEEKEERQTQGVGEQSDIQEGLQIGPQVLGPEQLAAQEHLGRHPGGAYRRLQIVQPPAAPKGVEGDREDEETKANQQLHRPRHPQGVT